MTPRGLTVAWVILPAVFVLLLGWELSAWRALASERARAATERVRLTRDIRVREEQLVAEMRGQAAALGEMQWSARGSDPGAFLHRLAELVQQRRIKVLGIEPLESQATPQFVKSWHTVRLQAPYRELRDLTARVEGERGIVEDVRLDVPPGPPGAPGAGDDDVQARLRLTTLELSPQARQILERVAAASGGIAAGAGAPGLLVPAPPPAPLTRDPFAFGPGAARLAAAPGAPRPPASPPGPAAVKPPPLRLTGIVSFPGGRLAIVNERIVRVDDVVAGHGVEAITETTVTVRAPGGERITLTVPDLKVPNAIAPKG